ncbi:MAG: YlmC/YmxH family sporulation protein [Eubacteriales bacterium]
MNLCRITDLRDKEVINICDGQRLGYVYDVEVDIICGKVVALVVPEEHGCFSLVHSSEIKIPWDKIDKIGDDIILVSLPLADIKPIDRKRKWFT